MTSTPTTGLAAFGRPGPLLILLALFATGAATAQQPTGFDEIAALEELRLIRDRLGEDTINSEFLSSSSSRIVKIETSAADCAVTARRDVERLEARREPLIAQGDDPPPELMEQILEVTESLKVAIAARDRCESLVDQSKELLDRITALQSELSQEFLSNRSLSAVGLLRDLPARAKEWPELAREAVSPKLVEGVQPKHVLLLLAFFGSVAALLGIWLRRRFAAWYESGGGDDAAPTMKYLVPKPVAEFAPLILVGLTFGAVLYATLADPSIGMLFIRIAMAIVAFGILCVIVHWSTGPLSPAANIDGLIPDHVSPVRLRLRMLFLAICISFVVLGPDWLSVRVAEPYVPGRAPVILLVGIAFLALLAYLPRIPGLSGRYRLLRYAAVVAVATSIVAVMVGFQNLAAFFLHGVTRTGIALYAMWILIWLVGAAFVYLRDEDTAAADRARASLGMSKRGSRTATGFVRLVAELLLWIAFGVYMIYVWDDSGATLSQLYATFMVGFQIGGATIPPPIKIIGGILIFVGILVVIGWLKRWIDRRWLREIAMERGARDAIVTLFGYVGFVVAVLIALVMSDVDLTGLALISGALALGLGFGLQEIANNFVSGIILLFERPIRAGDFVSVGDVQGYVRSIRIRATEIETLDNQNVLVPNSELVSGRVTNWVLRDTQGRLVLTVGVAYGSDVDKVRDILEGVANEHPEVITDGRAPAPKAFFMGFGDSSLSFELRVRVQRIERRFSVMSDLNFAIDRAFREGGVTIPFPQRDLHIISTPEGGASLVPARGKRKRRPSKDEYVTRSHTEELSTSRPIDEVWSVLVDDATSNQWLRDTTIEMKLGGYFEAALHDDLHVQGRVDVFRAPRHLRVVIPSIVDEDPFPSGPITIDLELSETDDGTKLVATIAGIPASEDWEEYYRLSVDAWHASIDDLKQLLRRAG